MDKIKTTIIIKKRVFLLYMIVLSIVFVTHTLHFINPNSIIRPAVLQQKNIFIYHKTTKYIIIR